MATTPAPLSPELEAAISGLPPFSIDVLRLTARIPAGEVRTYAHLAAELGRPGAARAVGSALRRNPVPILIPCHRVIRTDGTIGEYSGEGGSGGKLALLRAEGAIKS